MTKRNNEVFYLIIKKVIRDGRNYGYPQGGYFNKETAEKCCDLLNERHKIDKKFFVELHDLGFYNGFDLFTNLCEDEVSAEYYIEEVDVLDKPKEESYIYADNRKFKSSYAERWKHEEIEDEESDTD